jgi:hypothetical protein
LVNEDDACFNLAAVGSVSVDAHDDVDESLDCRPPPLLVVPRLRHMSSDSEDGEPLCNITAALTRNASGKLALSDPVPIRIDGSDSDGPRCSIDPAAARATYRTQSRSCLTDTDSASASDGPRTTIIVRRRPTNKRFRPKPKQKRKRRRHAMQQEPISDLTATEQEFLSTMRSLNASSAPDVRHKLTWNKNGTRRKPYSSTKRKKGWRS